MASSISTTSNSSSNSSLTCEVVTPQGEDRHEIRFRAIAAQKRIEQVKAAKAKAKAAKAKARTKARTKARAISEIAALNIESEGFASTSPFAALRPKK